MPPPSLAAAWKEFYERILVPQGVKATSTQAIETRCAFYAGAIIMFRLVIEGADEVPGEGGAALAKDEDNLMTLSKEMENWRRDLEAGRV